MREGPQVNEGIVIGGNAQIHDSALAAGRNASATTRHTSAPESREAARTAVAELRRRLEQWERTGDTPLAPDDVRTAREEATALEEELSLDGQLPDQALGRLERIQACLGGTTALMGLVTSVQESLRSITGG